jgi:hypothetical protein
LLIREE